MSLMAAVLLTFGCIFAFFVFNRTVFRDQWIEDQVSFLKRLDTGFDNWDEQAEKYRRQSTYVFLLSAVLCFAAFAYTVYTDEPKPKPVAAKKVAVLCGRSHLL